MKKRIALLLAVVMVLSCALTACSGGTTDDGNVSDGDTNADAGNSSGDNGNSSAGSDSNQTQSVAITTNRVILGSITELSGDFRYPGWGSSSAGASDQDIYSLTVGYSTMEVDQYGSYVWNQTSVKSHSEVENDDGTYTVTIEIADGLTFADGTPVTAANYLARTMAFGTPVAVAAGLPGTAGQAFVGYRAYRAYDGTNDGDGASKVFSGLRLLDEMTFSATISSDYYPYYYAYTYAAFEPMPLDLWLGEGIGLADDGDGVYLTGDFYEKDSSGDYVMADYIAGHRYDITECTYSGPYVISNWDSSTKEVTLTLNPNYKGNFEGQTPSIETVVYTKLIEETQLNQLTTGAVDVLSGITGGDSTKEALAVVDNVNFSEVHYQRAGYGKIEFDCDFGPTMFQEVRQAIAYLLDRASFCQTFTGGYGVVVDGPYSPDFSMWQAVKDDIELIDYSYSPDNAVRVLEEGGWVYNSKGEAFVAGQSGVDAVRYKKLTDEEANALDIYGNDAGNKTYASVANTDGVEYKTVEIDGVYYMPLAINWFGSTPNTVTDLLATTLANSTELAAAGMVIRSTVGDFTTLTGNIYRDPSSGYLGTPTYGMYNLATGWNSSIYDYAYNWMDDPTWADYSMNKIKDPYDAAFPYDITAEKLTYEEAYEASGGKLGMNYLSFAMVYNAKTEDEYNEWWMAYIERWNELLPDIPLYSNYYYDVYNSSIENFETSPFFGAAEAIIYANIKGF